jgi:hypothetical protein
MKYEKKCNPLANAVYDQVIEEFISGDTSCFFQTLVMLEDLNKSAIKEFMQGYSPLLEQRAQHNHRGHEGDERNHCQRQRRGQKGADGKRASRRVR